MVWRAAAHASGHRVLSDAGLGYFVGRLKIRRFMLGLVIGVLLAGVMLGQFGVTVAGDVKLPAVPVFHRLPHRLAPTRLATSS